MRQSFFRWKLNCRIIEFIFDMSLVYLSVHTLDHRSMSFMLVHVTKICCFDFIISNFRERSCIFRFELHEKSLEISTTSCGKFARTKDKFRRTLFALLLDNTVLSGHETFSLDM